MNRRHFVLLGLLGAAAPAVADDVTVIAHGGTSISAADVREIFTGDKQFAGSTKLVPVDNASAQEAFLAQFLKIDAAKYGTVWTKKAFRDGVTAPAMKASDAEVIEFVKKTPGAVAYVRSAPPGGVAVVK